MKPNCRLRYTVLTAAVALASMAPLVAGALANDAFPKLASKAVTVTYPFTNFRSTLPGVGPGRPDAHGSIICQKRLFRGHWRVIRLNWALPSKNPANNFVNFWWPRRLLGRPLAVQTWIDTPARAVGAPVFVEVRDATGQIFISRLKLNKPGWSEYRFPVAGVSAAWKSGAGDSRQHLPLELFSLGIEWPGHTGCIRLSHITVTSSGQPRQFVTCTPMTRPQDAMDVPHFTGWGRAPLCRLHLANYAHTPERNLAVTLRASDAITRQTVWKDRIPVPLLKGDHGIDVAFTPLVKKGVFNLAYSVSGQGGTLSNAGGSVVIAHMMGDVTKALPGNAAHLYARHWGLCGGGFWPSPPKRAAAAGVAWQRFWANNPWLNKAKLTSADLGKAVRNVESVREAGLGVVLLTTLYALPSLGPVDRAPFAPEYGRLMKRVATAFGPLVQWYELGNEDDGGGAIAAHYGTAKSLYTEIGRNGAAGVRSVDPMAMLGNSATGGVDIGWLRTQARRGLFDDLDAAITHPYTNGKSPEAFGVLKQFAQVNRFIDQLGGMKFQFTTEFGYDSDASNTEFFADQLRRAQWIPRHFAIAAAAGVLRNGLYNWDGAFGIYNNGAPYPAAVSVNAFCNFTYAGQFAGWWWRDPKVWAAMFARANRPVLMAWSPTDRGTLTLHGVTTGTRVYDIYGNLLSDVPAHGQLVLHLTGSPTYVTSLPTSMLRRALANAAHEARLRYARNLANSSLRTTDPWKHLAQVDAPSLHDLTTALEGWQPSSPTISCATQATVAESIRRMILAAHIAALTAGQKPAPWTGIHRAAWNAWADRLEHSVKQDDMDLPAVRWVLGKWRQTRDEAAMCHELGDAHLAAMLVKLNPVFDHLCAVLATHGPKVFFPIWPYLYQHGEKSPLLENLHLVSGKAVPIKVRIDSYAAHNYRARVALELPHGWSVSPSAWVGHIVAGRPRVARFMVTAGASTAKAIFATVSVPGKPLVRLPFDNFTVLPALKATALAVPGLLPQVPLPLRITNNSGQPKSAVVRILREPDGRLLASATAANLKPGQHRTLQLQLPRSLAMPVFNEWRLQADLQAEGDKQYQFPLTVDFSGVPYAAHAPTIGGDWSHWKEAAPLHLNKAAYTHGSFGNWRKSDLSGMVYTMWDKRYFYLAIRVRGNQPFHQTLDDGAVWVQDSVQLTVAPASGSPCTEISLAQTPRGPQVWCSTPVGRLIRDAQLNVKVAANTALYQCAIPWSDLPGIQPAAGTACRFDILLNKHYDGSRAYMERYGVAIVDATLNPAEMGWLHLLAPAGRDTALR